MTGPRDSLFMCRKVYILQNSYKIYGSFGVSKIMCVNCKKN